MILNHNFVSQKFSECDRFSVLNIFRHYNILILIPDLKFSVRLQLILVSAQRSSFYLEENISDALFCIKYQIVAHIKYRVNL